MDLKKFGSMEKLQDEPRVSPDGEIYRATKWRHQSGAIVEVNVDLEEKRYHARVNGGRSAVNLDEGGLVAFFARLFGR